MDGATTLRMIGVSPPRHAPVRSAGQAAPPERADGPILPGMVPLAGPTPSANGSDKDNGRGRDGIAGGGLSGARPLRHRHGPGDPILEMSS